MESKKIKFKRLAEKRVNRLLEVIRLLENLANRNNYEYSEEDIEKIFAVLQFQMSNAKNKFILKAKKSFKL